MTEETKKEIMSAFIMPKGLGKVIHIVAWGILFGIPFFLPDVSLKRFQSKVICVLSLFLFLLCLSSM